jgi:hypothetical protein
MSETAIRAYLVHLSYNMWADREAAEWRLEHVAAKPYLRFDTSLWVDILQAMVAQALNTVVIDLGDAVCYKSHPEIAVQGAWTVDRLRDELARVRALGLVPIPKLNFSACHDAWLGPYARCVSTPTYYEVCGDLIDEVIDLFDRPALFHLGMDEETAGHQRYYEYVVIRQYDLWWHDLNFLLERVQKGGARPWVWSDYVWDHPDLFFQRMPKSVLQSNWYYDSEFNEKVNYVKAYLDLEGHGYDQVPTGSNWSNTANMRGTVVYCRQHIGSERLKGFLQTVWKPTLEACRERHMEALRLAGEAFGGVT